MGRRVGLLLFAALAVLGPRTGSAAEALVDGIAAQVGSDIVLVSEVSRRSAPIEQQMVAAGAPVAEIARLRADILESLIERALIRQLVRRADLGATDADVDGAISAIAKENGITPQQLHDSVVSQGLPYELYREQIRGEIEHTKVINGMIASNVQVDESEIQEVFASEFAAQPAGGEEVHLRHLLVPVQSEKPSALRVACQRAGSARKRIVAGEDFGTVAVEMSPVNASRRGDLGWLHVDSLAGWMAPSVAALEPGQTSDVVQTRFGCNLLQVVERRTYTPVTYDEVRGRIRDRLFEQRMREEYVSFTNRLRDRTYIERKGFFADAARLGSGPSVGSAGSAP